MLKVAHPVRQEGAYRRAHRVDARERPRVGERAEGDLVVEGEGEVEPEVKEAGRFRSAQEVVRGDPDAKVQRWRRRMATSMSAGVCKG